MIKSNVIIKLIFWACFALVLATPACILISLVDQGAQAHLSQIEITKTVYAAPLVTVTALTQAQILPSATVTQIPTATPEPSHTPTETPLPTQTPVPSNTPRPTKTLVPSSTPVTPTLTPTIDMTVETARQLAELEKIQMELDRQRSIQEADARREMILVEIGFWAWRVLIAGAVLALVIWFGKNYQRNLEQERKAQAYAEQRRQEQAQKQVGTQERAAMQRKQAQNEKVQILLDRLWQIFAATYQKYQDENAKQLAGFRDCDDLGYAAWKTAINYLENFNLILTIEGGDQRGTYLARGTLRQWVYALEEGLLDNPYAGELQPPTPPLSYTLENLF